MRAFQKYNFIIRSVKQYHFFSSLEMVEGNVIKLLDGLSIDDNDELCDFTLADQNEAIGK